MSTMFQNVDNGLVQGIGLIFIVFGNAMCGLFVAIPMMILNNGLDDSKLFINVSSTSGWVRFIPRMRHQLNMSDDVVIVGGARTPFCEWVGGKRGDGKAGGALKTVSAKTWAYSDTGCTGKNRDFS